MALPDKHQLKFNIHKDAKTFLEAIEKSVSAASSKATVSTLPNVDRLSDAVIYSFFMAMLTMRAMRFLKRTRRNLGANGTNTIRFDMSKVECYNCHRRGHFAKECRSPRENRNKDTPKRTIPVESQFNVISYKIGPESVEARLVVYQKNETVFEDDIKLLKLDVMLRDNALAELRKKFEKAEKERDELKLTLDKFQTSSKNLTALATYFFLRRCLKANKRTELYYECMEPFKSLMCLWVRSRSIAAIWLEKVVTPLIEPAIKGFAAAPAVLKPKCLKVDKTRYE
nr:ribonuclease H-like domain-containing protein [Tanacetum cinerariifolium]